MTDALAGAERAVFHPVNLLSRRPEGPGDLAFLEDLFSSTHGGVLMGFDPVLRGVLLRQQRTGQDITYRAAFPDGRFDVIEVEGVPVGRVVTARPGDALTLVDLALTPDWQRRGIGTSLLRMLQDEARMAGVPLRLTVLRSNAGALRLYERIGFASTGGSDTHLDMTWMP